MNALALAVNGELLTQWLLPGAIMAVVVLVLVGIGFWIGRRAPRHSVREIGRALYEIARGRYDIDVDLTTSDDLAEIRRGVRDLLLHLKDRQRGPETGRSARLGDAYERIAGRALAVLDHDLMFAVVGEGFARIVGGRPIDFEGRPASRLFVEDGWNAWLPRLTDVDARRRGVEGRLALLRAEGEPVPVRVLAHEVGEPGEGILLEVEVWDERASAEERLRSSLERLQGVVSGLADGVAIVRDGEVEFLNPAATGWLGESAVGRPLKDLLPAEEMLLALDRVGRAAAGETVDPFTCWLVPGEALHPPRRVEVHAVPLGGNGTVGAAVLTIRPHAGATVSPERFRENEARLRAVLDTVPDGFFLLTPAPGAAAAWRVSLANARSAELLELAEPVRPGCTLDHLLLIVAPCFEEPAAIRRFLERAMADPAEVCAESFDLPGTEPRSLELVVQPVSGGRGEDLGRILTLRDVTRHRRLQQQLASDAAELGRSRDSLQRSYEELSSAHRELERRSQELDRLNRELTELDGSRAELMSKVAHDLQTPLVSIRGYTQMVLEGRLGKVNDEQRHGLEVAVRNIDRMVQLISNLLALARSEAGQRPEVEAVEPAPLVEELCERHRGAAEQRGLKLEHVIEGIGWRLLADPGALDRVLDNLVSNAIKFNRPGGTVTVRLSSADEGMALIEVSDTGIGIPDEEQQRVFERFFRGREASRVSGTGIGLATVLELVESHQGHVELSSEPGEGTTIQVRWPMAAADSGSAVAG